MTIARIFNSVVMLFEHAPDGCLEILPLPDTFKGSIAEVAKCLDRLPQGIGLYLERGSLHFGIFETEDALLPRGEDDLIGERNPSAGGLDHDGGELLQPASRERQRREPEPGVSDDFVLLVHRVDASLFRRIVASKSVYRDRSVA
jgi:hypothetical protein